MNGKILDDYLRNGDRTGALRHIATEYYENGRMGYTYSQTVSQAADEIDRLTAELAEYKRLEDDGRLVRLPCKPGSIVYQVVELISGKRRIAKGIIFEIAIFQKKQEYYFADDLRKDDIWLDPNCFSKTVFLTRAEAEAALKGEKQ